MYLHSQRARTMERPTSKEYIDQAIQRIIEAANESGEPEIAGWVWTAINGELLQMYNIGFLEGCATYGSESELSKKERKERRLDAHNG